MVRSLDRLYAMYVILDRSSERETFHQTGILHLVIHIAVQPRQAHRLVSNGIISDIYTPDLHIHMPHAPYPSSAITVIPSQHPR